MTVYNGKTRFIKTLKGEIPDKIPVFECLDSRKFFKYLLGYNVEEYNAKDVMIATKKLNLDATFIGYGGGFMGTGNTKTYIDEWGTTFRKNPNFSWPWDAPIDFPIKRIEDVKKFKLPDPNRCGRLKEIKTALDMAEGNIAVMGAIQGPLTTAFLLAGWTTLAYFLTDNPDMLKQIFRLSNEFYNQAIINMIDAGVDVIYYAEDLGFHTNTFFSPIIYKEFLYPFIKEQIDIIKERNIPIFFHCDGNKNSIMEDIMNFGFDCLNPIEKNANMDFKEIKKKYGNKITLHGTIDSSLLLPFGSKEEVIKETKKSIEIGKVGGRFIFGSDSDIRDDMPVENIMAMFDTYFEYCNY
jgi:uroporphyrinogen decarboxylase